MRFKVKLPHSSKYLFVTDESSSPTLGTLKKVTADAFETIGLLGVHFEISLNGKVAIPGDENTLLADAGVVSGDVIRILTQDEFREQFRMVSDSSELDSSSSAESVTSQSRDDASKRSNRFESEAVHLASVPNESLGTLQNMTIDGEQPIDAVVINRCLREPILCRESTHTEIPETLRSVYTNTMVKSVNDALVVVLHVMMLEAGYVQKMTMNADQHLLSNETVIGHTYRIKYAHVSCPNSSVALTIIPFGSTLAVNGTYQCTTFHMDLNPQQFVCSGLLDSPSVAVVYNNLSRLSRLFKDAIVYPLLTTLQAGEGIPSSCGINSLSTEVKMIILNFLTASALLNLSETCKEFNELANQQSLWKRLCFADFPEYISERFLEDQSLTWKQKYQVLYKKRKLRAVNLGPYFLGPPPYAVPFPGLIHGPTGVEPPPLPGMLPGMIGGEFDRIPAIYAVPPEMGIHPLLPPPGPRMLQNPGRFPYLYRPNNPRRPDYFPRFT